MHAGQVKEAVKQTCSICGSNEYVSFYSYEICRNCHSCPSCGGKHTLQSFTYTCVETKEKLTGVRCSCGASFKERAEMDKAIVALHQSMPHHICKVCGSDVKEGDRNVCSDCVDCPHCKSGVKPTVRDNGELECPVCQVVWESASAWEKELVQTRSL